ncbi:MAG TPA: ATP-binding protein [Actinomycetales bacterium]|nr:ATP-binding protein [Actinomycetales bacterium]
MIRTAWTTAVASAIAVVGAVNLGLAVEWEQLVALGSPDAWLPLTAALAGWLVLRLDPRNAVGWVLLTVGASSAMFGSAALIVQGQPDLPSAVLHGAAWLSAWVFLPSYMLSFLALPLLFPDGRPPAPLWRHVLTVALVLVLVESVLLAFGSRETVSSDVANPLQWGPATEVLEAVEPVIWISMPLLALLGVASLVHRYVMADRSVRRAIAVVAGTLVIGLVALLVANTGLVLGLLLPLTIAALVAQALHDDLVQQRDLALAQARDLQASRARIVHAHDAAKRRIERDLHDGAQQQLLALSVGLGRLAARSDESVTGDISRLQHMATNALADLRHLASGTYPSALRELGVSAGLREAVVTGMSLRDDWGSRPSSEEVEAALYFACLEAVTNAHKHSGRSCVDVTLDRSDGAYRFTVTDTGRGFDDRVTGSGLTGMADRLGAVGGTLTVTSAHGMGTTVVGVAYDSPR